MTDRNKKEFSPEEQAIVQTAIDKSYQRDIHRAKINQTIHEARGLCWHKQKDKLEGDSLHEPLRARCEKCGCIIWTEGVDSKTYNLNPDYTSDWSAWGAALEWAQEEEWWEIFAYDWNFNEDLLNPLKGATALTKFIDKHPDIFEKEVSNG